MSQNSSPAELREIGLKVTAPRIKVLEFFQQNPSSHYSAEEVYMALSKDDSDIGLPLSIGFLLNLSKPASSYEVILNLVKEIAEPFMSSMKENTMTTWFA